MPRRRSQEVQAGIRGPRPTSARWQSEFARVEQLVRERALTGSLLDETRSKLQAAEAGRDEVKAKVQSAEAALAEAKALLDKARSDVEAATSHIEVARFEAERAEAMAGYARIVAPYRRRRDPPEGSTPATSRRPGTAGEPLFVVARSDIVTIAVGVPETDAPFVNTGDPARVRLQALERPDVRGQGDSHRLGPRPGDADAPRRDRPAERRRRPPPRPLRLRDHHRRGAQGRPDRAHDRRRPDGGKSFCVTVADGHARRKEVKLGLSDGKRTEVVSGLGEDEMVVEANAASLADGQPVEKNEPPGGRPEAEELTQAAQPESRPVVLGATRS